MAATPEGHIVVIRHNVSTLFLAGKIVFKILKSTKEGVKPTDYWMCTTHQEYQTRLESHEYIPILFVAPLTYKLAYLYGCLNRVRGIPRTDTFVFLFREIGKPDWKEWFIVHPYKD